MSQYQEKATVVSVEQLSEQNFRILFNSPDIARSAGPGQFVMIRTGSGKDPLLRRPFSIHQTSTNGQVQIYFKVVGRGTDLLSRVKKGDILSVLGPLGRGFTIKDDSPAILVGGGLGMAPMLFLAQSISRLKNDCGSDHIILGGSKKSEVEPLVDDFTQYGMELTCATDDGSYGHRGYVTDILEPLLPLVGATVYGCGPELMMAAVYTLCKSYNIPCQVSVESVMACGMGACLGCSRITRNGTYAHVCLNGPVFNAEELIWKL